jgi:SET domain-containing protein
MLLIETYVASSEIEGVGLFTKVDIKKGQIIWTFNALFDKKFTEYEKKSLPEHIQKFIDIYGFLDKSGWWVLDGGNDKYVNHGNQPNLIESDIPNEITRDLIAVRDIKAGEELTENYKEWDLMVDLKNI